MIWALELPIEEWKELLSIKPPNLCIYQRNKIFVNKTRPETADLWRNFTVFTKLTFTVLLADFPLLIVLKLSKISPLYVVYGTGVDSQWRCAVRADRIAPVFNSTFNHPPDRRRGSEE